MSTRPLFVFGAGGHGKVVADVLLAAGQTVAGFVDDAKPHGTIVLGLPVVGGSAWLADQSSIRIALGVGDNTARMRVAAAIRATGCELVTAIHPRAIVARSAVVETGVVIMAASVVNADAIVRRGAIVNTAAVIEHDCEIGEFAHVSPNATLGGGCRVGSRAQLGIGATMLPGTSIDEDTLVGGGAVVTSAHGARLVLTGVPARVHKRGAR